MNIEVEIHTGPLSRKMWRFDVSRLSSLRLTFYTEQTQETKRHKWRGPFWDFIDERGYNSKLKRPTRIPPEVITQARAKLAELVKIGDVYIGWFHEDHLYREDKKS
jgi:hypothetical protein